MGVDSHFAMLVDDIDAPIWILVEECPTIIIQWIFNKLF